ncbi:hypothetical protein CEUSTIGMA_g13835.t1 [Chlamydomonas eustigma]|uniref:Uncharacterized protein n=1 Tax=Chlamydomonas eustigma TaxID=1157962 RepID=A0A250XTM1_9CHLO|nr:hypothetical protein CEUSTIGMA_g13835.t1 [Chlamydomonas eustigma]|eukprot:GAX86425.1 hypothetical protein CEUSTIGMA_g13835.t1 [Chlamydomonas eustigma]
MACHNISPFNAQVIATGGDSKLGGDDFTMATCDLLSTFLPGPVQRAWREGRASPGLKLALRQSAEEAKVQLSTLTSVDIQIGIPCDDLALEDVGSTTVTSCSTEAAVDTVINSPAASSSFPKVNDKAVFTATVTRSALEHAVQPLVARLWPPLRDLAIITRTQLGGQPPDDAAMDEEQISNEPERREESPEHRYDHPRVPGTPAVNKRGPHTSFNVFSSTEQADNERRKAASKAKYSAPPRRLTGLIFVGAATRMPGVRELIEKVTGLEARQDVDPEMAVALGAAVHAGVIQGTSSGVELTDGSYVADLHNRSTSILSDWSP